MRAILLLLAALLGSPAEPANIATGAIKRFGVASVIADKFTRSYIGFSAFTNKVEEIDVTSWGIDAAYAEQLGKVAAVLSAQYVAAPTTPHLDVQTDGQTENARRCLSGAATPANFREALRRGDLRPGRRSKPLGCRTNTGLMRSRRQR
jgi:hypothetical protein